MCSVGLSVVYVTTCIFAILRYTLFTNGLILMAVLYLLWLLFHSTLTLLTVSSASSTILEGRYLEILVFKAMNYVESNEIVQRLRVFAEQLILRRPVFTCGLFIFDWTLFYSVIHSFHTLNSIQALALITPHSALIYFFLSSLLIRSSPP